MVLVLHGNGVEAHPVTVALILGREGRAHADPVLRLSVLVRAAHHVAEAVVCLAGEIAVGALAALAIDNLAQTGYLLDAHVNRGPLIGRAAARVGQRAHVGVAVCVGGRVLVDAGTHQVGKVAGCGLHVVGLDDAGQRAVALRHAVGRLEGLVSVIGIVGVAGDELTHDAPELRGFRSLLFRLRFAACVVVVVIVLAGGDAQAEAAHKGGHQPNVHDLFHFVHICYCYTLILYACARGRLILEKDEGADRVRSDSSKTKVFKFPEIGIPVTLYKTHIVCF